MLSIVSNCGSRMVDVHAPILMREHVEQCSSVAHWCVLNSFRIQEEKDLSAFGGDSLTTPASCLLSCPCYDIYLHSSTCWHPSVLFVCLGMCVCACSCTYCIVRTRVFNQQSEDILSGSQFYKTLFESHNLVLRFTL